MLRCGPSEYHVDVTIHAEAERRLWRLSDLLGLPEIRDWMRANRVDPDGKQRVVAEVQYAFTLLTNAATLVPELRWLRRGDPK